MVNRTAILPFPGDPFLLNYWLDLYDRVWCDEVDFLFIYMNSPIEKEVVDWIYERVKKSKNAKIYYTNVQMEHGHVIDHCLDLVDSKYVMLIEDDGFIFKKGQVDRCFKQLESGNYDIVGSRRASCAMEILKRAQELWGLSYEGEGDTGPNFWPNFFFCERELLIKTDRNFAAKAWKKGDSIDGLGNYLVQDDVIYGDTFVNISLQLRAMVPEGRILCVPQYHGHPDDLEHWKEGRYLFDGQAPWCHIGSLSSGVGGLLMDRNGRRLARRKIDPPLDSTILPNICTTYMEHREFERRVQWWLTCIENVDEEEVKPIWEFYVLYKEAIARIIAQFELSMNDIRKRQNAYTSLGL